MEEMQLVRGQVARAWGYVFFGAFSIGAIAFLTFQMIVAANGHPWWEWLVAIMANLGIAVNAIMNYWRTVARRCA